jgi:uncharacterized protein (DUF1778 family)
MPAMATRRRKNARITLRLPAQLKKLIEAAADQDRRTVTDWCLVQLEIAATREVAKNKS